MASPICHMPEPVDIENPERYLNCGRALELLWEEVAAEGDLKVAVKFREGFTADTNTWTFTAHASAPGYNVMPLIRRLLARGIIPDHGNWQAGSLDNGLPRTTAAFIMPVYWENKMIPL